MLLNAIHFFFVFIIIFYCSIDSFADCLDEFKTKVEGIYPLAAENSENEVLLINSVGAYIITMNGNVDKKTSSITSTYSSDLIHYKDNIFFLIGGAGTLTIHYITASSSGGINAIQKFSGQGNNISVNNVFSARLIKTNNILVSWYNEGRYNIKLFKISENNDISESGQSHSFLCSNSCSDIICDYYNHDGSSKIVCTYISDKTLKYYIINDDLTSSLSQDGFSFEKCENHKFIKLKLREGFIVCYGRQSDTNKTVNCALLTLNGNNLSVTKELLLEQEQNLKITSLFEGPKNAIYVLILNGAIDTKVKVSLYKLSSLLYKASSFLNFQTEYIHYQNTTIFSLGNEMIGVGYSSYVSQNETSLQTFVYPTCEDFNPYISSGNELAFTLSDKVTSTNPLPLAKEYKIYFESLPNNAGIQVNESSISTFTPYKKEEQFLIAFSGKISTSSSSYYVYINDEYTSYFCNFDVTVCYSTCKTCSNGSATALNHFCLECQNGYYLISNTQNCVNNDSKPSNYYFNQQEQKYYPCYETCATCNGGGNPSFHNCILCLHPNYKVEGEDIGMCKDLSREEGYYLNLTNQMFMKCHSSCKNCTGSGNANNTNCLYCATNFKKYLDDSSHCSNDCHGGKWYLFQNNRSIMCEQSDTCSYSNYNLMVYSTNHCVRSCSIYDDPDCIECAKTRLFEYNNICYENCPEGTTKDYQLYTCKKVNGSSDDPTQPTGNKKIIFRVSNKNKNFNDFFLDEDIIKEYQNLIQTEQIVNNCDIDLTYFIVGYDFTTTMYKLINIDAFPKFDIISRIEISSLFSNNRRLSTDEIFIAQVDTIREDSPTNQTEYALFTSESNKTMDLTPYSSSNITIEYPIRKTYTSPTLNLVSEMQNQSINIYNSSESFYNDICFTFTSNTSRDVTIEDRRKYYYPSENLCEENCEMISIDFKANKIKCMCRVKTQYSNIKKPNPKNGNLTVLSIENYNSLKCYDTVFDFDSFFSDIPFWVFGFLVLIQLAVLIWSCCSGTNFIKQYLNNFVSQQSEYVNQGEDEAEKIMNLRNDNDVFLSQQVKKGDTKRKSVQTANHAKETKKKSKTKAFSNPPMRHRTEKNFNLQEDNDNSHNENEVTGINNDKKTFDEDSLDEFKLNDMALMEFNPVSQNFVTHPEPKDDDKLKTDPYCKTGDNEENKNKAKRVHDNCTTEINGKEPMIDDNNNNGKGGLIKFDFAEEEKGNNYENLLNDDEVENKNHIIKIQKKNKEGLENKSKEGEKDEEKDENEGENGEENEKEEDRENENNHEKKEKMSKKKKKYKNKKDRNKDNIQNEEEEQEQDETENENESATQQPKKKYNKKLIDHDESLSSRTDHILILKNKKIQTKSEIDDKNSDRELEGDNQNSLPLLVQKISSGKPLPIHTNNSENDKHSVNSENKLSVLNSKRSSIQQEDIVINHEENPEKKKKPKEKRKYSFFKDFCFYFSKREIFLLAATNRKEYFPSFALWSLTILCFSIIFGVHSIFYTTENISKRFLLREKSVTISFLIENELMKCIISALICNGVKMLFIKLFIYALFKVNKKKISKDKINSMISLTRCKLIFFFSIIFILNCGVFYVNASYGGIFINSKAALFIGFGVTYVISFVVCLVLCFFINIIRGLGECCNCCCLLTIYKVLKFIY